MDPMLGMIFMLPFQWAPIDYSFCQGQSMRIQQYAALYSLIGTLYGGDQVNNFNLPNLQGRVPLGAGTSQAIPPGVFQLASKDGAATATLTQAQLPMHTHTATFAPQYGQQTVTIPAVTNTLKVDVEVDVYGAAGDSNLPSTTNNMLAGNSASGTKLYTPAKTTNLVKLSNVNTTVTGNAGSPSANVNVNTVVNGTVGIGVAGASQPVSLMQPYLAMNFVIAINGLYPSRP